MLRRAEVARLRDESRAVSLSMTSARDAAEYQKLESLAEVETFHAQIALAERDGAIVARRDRLHGDGQKLLRLSVADLPALARHLGIRLLDEKADAASTLLSPWVARFPIINEVLDAWRQGRKVHGADADSAGDLAAAAHAVAARQGDSGHERILRRESVRLFGSSQSKRLEKLTPWLEVLVTGELAASGLEKEHVWAALGLRREPQPMRVCGEGTAMLDDGDLPLLRPYLGLPVESLRRLQTQATCLLTIENLASFHDATQVAGRSSALLLYTGGMPSPAWRTAYARILRELPAQALVLHWGDIDEGGFRIAATLAKVAQEAGRTLRPWRMSPHEIPSEIAQTAETPDATVLAAMVRWAERAGWNDIAQALLQQPIRLEQESLDAVLP
ncbi:MAG: DUF2220 family protein [Pseudoxanthomonas sp.]